MTKREWLLLIAIVLFAFSLRMIFLHEPLERDEGLYGYVGQEILRGDLPYRDAIDHKPPGIHYLYAAIIATLGATPEAIRFGAALCAAGTLLAVFLCARRLYGTRAALWSALLFGVFSSGPHIHGAGSNAEVFMALPIVLSMHSMLGWFEEPRRLALVASGLLLGCAMVIKFVAAPHVMVGAAFIGLAKEKRSKSLVALIVFLVSSLMVPAITAIFFQFKGALSDCYHWTIVFNREYGKAPLPELVASLRHGLFETAPEWLPLAVLAAPLAVLTLAKQRSRPLLFPIASVGAAAVGVSTTGKFFEHYFIQIVPPLAILAGAGLTRLTEQRRAIATGTLVAFAGSLALWAIVDFKYYLVYSPEQVSIQKYGSEFVDAAEVARYIKERTTKSDYVYQWGYEPEIYFLTERRAPNPFTLPFTVAASPDPQRAARELADSIAARRPVYIVRRERAVAARSAGHRVIDAILARDYTHEITLQGSQLWRIRLAPGG